MLQSMFQVDHLLRITLPFQFKKISQSRRSERRPYNSILLKYLYANCKPLF